jgi:hypothetical protein
VTSLGNIDFDTLPDGDGNSWYMADVVGWQAPVHRHATAARLGTHGDITLVNTFEGRQLTFMGFAVCETDQGYYDARQTLITETSVFNPLLETPMVLTVDEDIARRMNVVKTGLQIRCIDMRVLDFELNLFADDPVKYADVAQTLVTSGTATNYGDTITYPTFTLSAPGTPILMINGLPWSATGALPSGTVIDMGRLSVIGGVMNYFANVSTSSIWSGFGPGNNTVTSTVAGTWEWRDGYQ